MLDVVGLLSLSDTCPDPLCTKLHKVQYNVLQLPV